MSSRVEELKPVLAALSAEDRAGLACYLIRTLDPPRDTRTQEEWDEELKRRIASLESGAVKGIPADEVIKRARERIQSRQ